MSEPSRVGCVVALALVFLPGVVMHIFGGPLPGEEWPDALVAGVLFAIPFGYLALDGTRDWMPRTVATFLSAVCWGLLLKVGGPGPGAALIMLAIPVLITGAAWASNQRIRS